MVDISPTLIGKSQRLNADDLTEDGRIITVTGVRLSGDAEQPLAISYEGDGGRPFYPCITMRRVIAHLWGTDGSQFAGRRLHLYRDPTVTFGRDTVGGIRIKAVSNIDRPVTCSMTVSRGKRKSVTIKALPEIENGENRERAEGFVNRTIARINSAQSNSDLSSLTSERTLVTAREKLRKLHPELDEKIASVINAKLSSFEDTEVVW